MVFIPLSKKPTPVWLYDLRTTPVNAGAPAFSLVNTLVTLLVSPIARSLQ